MKTIRTVCVTAGCIFLFFFCLCLLCIHLDTALLQRTVFYLLQRVKFIFLILCGMFFLICMVASFSLNKLDRPSHDEKEDCYLGFEEDSDENEKSFITTKADEYKKKSTSVRNNKHTSESDENDQFSFDEYENIGAEYSSFVLTSSVNTCPHCGIKLKKNSSFCDFCGSRIL